MAMCLKNFNLSLKSSKRYRLIYLLGFLTISLGLHGQSGITTININNVSGDSTRTSPISASDAIYDIVQEQTYDIDHGTGNNAEVTSYVIGGTTYDNFLEPDTLAIQRTDGGRFINIWYTLITDPDGNSNLKLDPNEVEDADLIYRLRSVNGMDFEPIANIDGAGNSQGVINYQFVDRNPLDGFSFYRLRQTDFSGEYDYSEVRSVYVERLNEVRIDIFPNPVSIGEVLKLSHNLREKKSAIIQVFDLNGKISLKEEIQLDPLKAVIELETDYMSRGINVIKVILQDGKSFTFRALAR